MVSPSIARLSRSKILGGSNGLARHQHHLEVQFKYLSHHDTGPRNGDSYIPWPTQMSVIRYRPENPGTTHWTLWKAYCFDLAEFIKEFCNIGYRIAGNTSQLDWGNSFQIRDGSRWDARLVRPFPPPHLSLLAGIVSRELYMILTQCAIVRSWGF